VAIDHHAAELEIAHAALEFIGGALRILYRDVGKARVALRPLVDFFSEKIVGLTRLPRRRGRIPLGLNPRARDRKNRFRDAGLVHRLQASTTEVREPLDQLLDECRRDLGHCRLPIVGQSRRQEMFFDRDLLNHAFPQAFVRRKWREKFFSFLYRILG